MKYYAYYKEKEGKVLYFRFFELLKFLVLDLLYTLDDIILGGEKKYERNREMVQC